MQRQTCFSILGALAKSQNVAVRTINNLDANRNKPNDAGQSVFRQEINLALEGHQFKVSANEFTLAVWLKTPINRGVLSINSPDAIMCTKLFVLGTASKLGLDMYTLRGEPCEISDLALASRETQSALESLSLKNDESIHIYGNGIMLYYLAPTPQDALKSCRSLLHFANVIAKHSSNVLAELPPEFKDLQYLADEWNIRDDAERAEKMRSSPKQALLQLTHIVGPQLDTINRYLEQHDDEGAHALASLAEAASEAISQLRAN